MDGDLFEAVDALRGLYTLVEQNRLVRNPMNDGESDWVYQMTKFVDKLKKAHDVLEKYPADTFNA